MTDTEKYAIVNRLFATIESRRGGDAQASHVARLFAKGRAKVAQKVGEEAVETVIAALQDDRQELVSESADLLFHLMVLWAECGLKPEDILAELERREGVSGIAEKKSREAKD